MKFTVNHPAIYFKTEEEKTKYTLDYIDKFILDIPSYGNFHITDHMTHPNIEEKKKLRSIISHVVRIMIEEGMLEVPYNANAMLKMTNLGREIKNEGGYYNYLQNMKEKELNSNQNIITNNMYGDNNSLNNAVGTNITISSTNSISLSDNQRQELKAIGVQEQEVEELNNIISEDTKDKGELSKKLFAWVSSVTASLVSRGLYDHIPQVSNFVNQFI
ncbi:hypothetical protein J2787_000676 [Chryseobacterium rhizosphaerae]|uniref:Uncharacterized protein n=1 Tax=Chryseobacterium rhizosphaerae TaxID=395937 RepID=A0AAE3Y7Y1_9FLAO|nr:hypothetical protein [Chryseobacterium rhizosphaerae]MDR6525306.1 hypothetical protein [Chryseobacterium rhizosphaerae]